MANDGLKTVQVTVVVSLGPRHTAATVVFCAADAMVLDAIKASALLTGPKDFVVDGLEASIWGRTVALTQLVQAGDRIELTRTLTVDPKVARRERFTRQGAKVAGLFSKRRAGAKAGY